ncbi:microtubule-actin cross-linking factor 1 isoform X2 [Tetranychus urticae]|uniref:microtubule-actin cross-linking factor 1 isoform X2 n=1 Tax=Tetranychus urticae TaxID=32264 RepID=UPI000D649080|nr:microtubule-actin cross-linking factor 1 isoform X2 [Tetranychus urticae]
MAPSPARITNQGPSRNSFEASLRSSDSPSRSTVKTRPLNSRDKSPNKSPTRSPVRETYRPDSWKTRPESQNTNDSSTKTITVRPASSSSVKSSSSSISRTVSPGVSGKSTPFEAKYDSKNWEKCGERESTWPKMAEKVLSAEAPLTSAKASSTSATASSISSVTTNRSQNRSPSRESEKKVRINLEPMAKSSYSHEYHSEMKSSSSSTSKRDDKSPITETSTTTSSSSKEVIECSIEVPEDGWSLKDSIRKKLLNPKSADVVDPARLSSPQASGSTSSPISSRPVSLYRALEKGLLDEHGSYSIDNNRSKISLEEAIDRGFVTFDDKVKTSDSLVTRVIKIVRTEGISPKDEVTLEPSPIGMRSSPIRSSIRNRSSSPPKMESTSSESKRFSSTSTHKSESFEDSKSSSGKVDSTTKYEEFVEIGTNIFYCPSSDTVFDEVTSKRSTLAESLANRNIDWAKFSVIDTLTGKPISLSEAISRKILDPVKYTVVDKKRGKTYTLPEAVRRGLFILSSSPLLLMESASAASQVTINPSLDESDSGRPGSRLIRETVQVLKSREIFIKDPSTGQEVALEEAVRKGLVDRETADRLRAQESSASGFSVNRSVNLTVHDPRTGQEIPIDLAVRKGIIDQATADRIRRGEVIENVISTNVTLVDDETENWSDIVSEINERLDLITEFKAFQQNYTLAKKWLDGVERRIHSLVADDDGDLINIESKRSQVNMLKAELSSQFHLIKTVDESAELCKIRMDRDSIEFNRIERLTRALHDQYKSCVNSANDLEKRLTDLDQARSKYYSKVSSIDKELESISSDFNKICISSSLSLDEKEIKLITLESRLTSQRSYIGECEAICDHLCRLLASSSEQIKARNSLNEIERKYREISGDIKDATLNYKDFESFSRKANEFSKWQSTIETSLSKSSSSTSHQLSSLRDEFERIESIIKSIQSREVDYEDLIESGNDLISRLENSYETNTIRSKLETINSSWESIRSSAESKINQLEASLQASSKAKETLRKFNSYLDSVETDLSNLPETTCNQMTNEKSLSFVDKLKSSLDQHKSEYVIVSNLKVIGSDKSTNLIEKEVKESCSRYEKVYKETTKKYEQLREMVGKLESLDSTLKQVASEVERFECKVASSQVMSSTSCDSKLFETTKGLLNQSSSLIDKVEQSKRRIVEITSETVNSESNSFVNEINHYVDRVKSINHQLSSRLESIESASAAIDKIRQKLDKAEAQLKQEEKIISRFSSISSESVALEKQMVEVEDIYHESDKITSNLDELNKMVMHEETRSLGKEWETTYRHFVHLIRSMETKHSTNLTILNQRKEAIKLALNETRQFEQKLHDFDCWLTETESQLEKMEEASYLTETLETQMNQNQQLQESIRRKQSILEDLEKSGKQRDLLMTIRHRWNRLTSRCTERSQILDRNLKLAREFVDKWTSLIDWLTETEVTLETRSSSKSQSVSSRLMETRNNYKNLLRSFESKKSLYETTLRLGSSLRDKSPKSDSPVFQRMLNELTSKWESALTTITETLSSLEHDLNCSDKYQSLVKDLTAWIQSNQITLDGLCGDVKTVEKMIREHSAWSKSLKLQEDKMVKIKHLGEQLISNNVSSEDSIGIKREIKDLSRLLDELNEKSVAKEKRLKESLRKAEQLETEVNRLINWLVKIDSSVNKMDSSMNFSEETELVKYNQQIEMFTNEMEREEVNRDRLIADCQNVLLDCHPEAEYTIRHYITVIESKWKSVSDLLKVKSAKGKAAYNDLMDKANSLDQLLQWLSRAEQDFENMESQPIPDEPHLIRSLIEQFESFKSRIMLKESEFDQVATDYYNGNRQQQLGKERSSRVSNRLVHVKSLDVSLSSLTHSKAIEVVGRWQKLIKAINDRLVRLRSKHNYFSELERLKDFDFDAWRRRFLDWMNEKKAKIMDFFRKMDDDHDDKVNYEQFIDGFMRSKFPTSRSEMSKVVTIFDRNADGFVDSKEWIDTLKDKTEAEIIKDEVFRQVAQCTCQDKYKVHQVEERKYRFGESQKLRLVRILRSVVMVRVGGGWVSLNEFLLKNDPCRAKGRTNVELREPLADGVSQSMAAFQPKITSTPTEGNIIYGPVTKIREKTDRSMPMSGTTDGNEDSDSLGELRSRSRSQPRTGASSRASDGLSDVSLDAHLNQQQQQPQSLRMSRIDSKPRWR